MLQKSSFYIAKFENVVEDWRELEKADKLYGVFSLDETRHKMTELYEILFYKTGHLATNVK
jgi:hypothetical protein